MTRWAIAVAPEGSRVIHRIVEAEGQDAALRSFFDDTMADRYSKDDQGYFYFKEDFFDPTGPAGSMLEV